MITDYFKYEKVINCKDTREKCIGYVNYLQSKHWQKLRHNLIHKNTVCEICGDKASILQLHHKTYVNLGNESRKDFLILCDTCHKFVHKQKDLVIAKTKNSKKNKRKSAKIKRTCKNCKSFSRIKCGNKKQPYCQYFGKLHPNICDKFKAKK